jgi:hypothetical protein
MCKCQKQLKIENLEKEIYMLKTLVRFLKVSVTRLAVQNMETRYGRKIHHRMMKEMLAKFPADKSLEE